MIALRLLVERGKTDVAGGLAKLVDDQTVDETGLNTGAIHAVWTLAGLGKEQPTSGLFHKSRPVWCAALRAFPSETQESIGNMAASIGVTGGGDLKIILAASLWPARASSADFWSSVIDSRGVPSALNCRRSLTLKLGSFSSAICQLTD